MSVYLSFVSLLCMLTWLQFSSQVRDKRVAVGNPLHILLGHLLQTSIALLIQHSCLVSPGPESPDIVIYDVRHHQITLFVPAKFYFEIDQRPVHGRPGTLQGLKDALPLLRHPLDLRRYSQPHCNDILPPDLGIVTRIVLKKCLDKHRLEARTLAYSWMSLQVRACGDAPLHLFNRQHGAAAYQQRDIIDLLDKVRSNVFIIQQAEDIGRSVGTPT